MPKSTIGPSTHLHPKPAVLVGAMVEGKANFMTASWCGIACHQPPALSVAVRKERHTLKGIKAEQVFSVSVPSTALAKQVDYCGLYSGAKRDKSQVFDVFPGRLTSAPLTEECPIGFECRLIQTVDLGSHELVIGEIVETYVENDCLTDGAPDPLKVDPLIYSSGSRAYHRIGEAVAKAYRIGKEL